MRQLPSVPKNAISLNHRYLKTFTNSCGEPIFFDYGIVPNPTVTAPPGSTAFNLIPVLTAAPTKTISNLPGGGSVTFVLSPSIAYVNQQNAVLTIVGTEALASNTSSQDFSAFNPANFSFTCAARGTDFVQVITSPSSSPQIVTATGAFAQSVMMPSSIDTPFQVRYAANLNIGESYINITNTGANGAPLLGPGFGGASGNICANVYAFDPGEELISCCSCLVTPDQTVNLGVVRDLTVKTLTGVRPTSVTVKLLATLAGTGGSGTSCTNSATTVNVCPVSTHEVLIPIECEPGDADCEANNACFFASIPGFGAVGLNGCYSLGQGAPLVPGGCSLRGNLAPAGLAAYGTTLHATPTAGSFATTETRFTPSTLSAGESASIAGRCSSILGNGSGFGVCNSCSAGGLGSSKSGQ